MKTTSTMSIRQKIGQLMMIGFKGKQITPSVTRMLEDEMVGGIILFPTNIGSPEEVLKLNEELQHAAHKAAHPYPLIISTDQENGVVRRLKQGVTEFPGNMLLGAVDSAKATMNVSRATALELKALGFNMNLAPDVDVNNNPHNPVIGVRSFGENSKDVAKHCKAFIQGHHDAGIMTTVKHFPGHGDTELDSHADLPVIQHSMKRLEQIELLPFVEAIDTGTDSVMMSHINFSSLEEQENIPASISEKVTTGLLRERLGFEGAIMTDCLEMNAIVKTIGTAEGALAALKAGSDLLMISHTNDLQMKAIDRIEKAVMDREINEDVIDRSLNRVMELKKKYLSWNERTYGDGVPPFVGGEKHKKLAQGVFERGVTLVKNENLLPLKVDVESKILVVTVKGQMQSPVEGKREKTSFLGETIASHHYNIYEQEISKSPENKEIEKVIVAANDADIVIFGSDYAYTNEGQAYLIRKLLEKQASVIVVAVGNPYDLAELRNVPAYLATYEYSKDALQSAANIIFGTNTPMGKLPVTIPSL
ncbi:beta-N-acetylhexosaminidase [Virgibacillus doumboii]|uniref:beta-N-acetylhexosaminidase n=1 Tax=Virgibacillus doumboii TaxID=2697503 RepID=UPI0013E03E09|nr:beta-N-acetylhexosaminidase [Virgibacillus doumboii]